MEGAHPKGEASKIVMEGVKEDMVNLGPVNRAYNSTIREISDRVGPGRPYPGL
jgi:hypothetical protein